MAGTFRAVMIHGLLGTNRDFALMESAMKRAKMNTDIWYPELFKEGPCSAQYDYEQWTENFLKEIKKRFGSDPIPLVGYSLGGRLALHACMADPKRFSQVWLLSTNPGVPITPKAERQAWEKNWAKRFLKDSWVEVVSTWNEQQVFNQTMPRILPQESLFDRKLLSESFTRWSLHKHCFELVDLHRLPNHTQWWFGSLDHKFLSVKAELERQTIPGTYRILPGAGHRLTLDAPGDLARALMERIGEVDPWPALLLN